MATMGAAMLDENCMVQCPIWYRQSVAENMLCGGVRRSPCSLSDGVTGLVKWTRTFLLERQI